MDIDNIFVVALIGRAYAVGGWHFERSWRFISYGA